jgi:hypothetical protein
VTVTRTNDEKERCNESDTEPQEDKETVAHSGHYYKF